MATSHGRAAKKEILNENASMKFLHTADWQLGKPFAGTDDPQKRALLQNERFNVIRRIGGIIQDHQAEFVVVAGDLFDSPCATKPTVSAACSAIGALKVPVYVIPGNHDHGGPGSLWEQEFFKSQRGELAPNLQILLKPEPVILPSAVLFPCPLLRRHESDDPTLWLRSSQDFGGQFGDKPRIVIAHGSVIDFGSFADDEETDGNTNNLIDVSRLTEADFDYIALGDWHGAKKVGPKSWYSGTPELDQFVKGSDHNPGNVLVVEAGRGELPNVQMVHSGAIDWHEIVFDFPDDLSLDQLKQRVNERIGTRANRDLLRLQLNGSLGIEASTELNRLIESWGARLLRVKLDDQTIIAPSATELDGLKSRSADPLVSRVAGKLEELAKGSGEEAAIARVALRELYIECNPR